MMGFAVIIGAVLAKPTSVTSSSLALLLGFITGFSLTGASMTVNDYYDRKIDAINEPKRPIPSGAIRPSNALSFAAMLMIIGFMASYFTNLMCLVLAVLSWGILALYTTVGKRSGFPGNLLVSICVAVPFIYGNSAMTNTIMSNVTVFASIVFLSNTGREIVKGIADVEGDKTQNIRTLAVQFGQKKAALIAALFFVLSVLLSSFPWIIGFTSAWFIPPVIVTDVGLLYSTVILLRDSSRKSAKKIKAMVLVWFLFGLIAFLLGALL